MSDFSKKEAIDALLRNRINLQQLVTLRNVINEVDLSLIIRNIYDLGDEQIRKIAALAPAMAKVDALKNSRRNHLFYSRVKGEFRKKASNRVIVAEGDSWFNYPVLLSDVIDWITMEDNLAVYSVASGGDWLLNMLNAKKYIEQLSTLHPDVFLISGGGNDLVGSNRLAAMVNPLGNSDEMDFNPWARQLIQDSQSRPEAPALSLSRFNNGLKYISKDFFALLMFFHLQYHFIFSGILEGGEKKTTPSKFPDIKIITQGYDYVLPSLNKAFGLKPWRWYKPFARLFLGHGGWLKRPLELRGISDCRVQEDIVYAMIYLFNEMMIHTGAIFNTVEQDNIRVFHIDSRGAIGNEGWTDELHPLPENFKRVGQAYIDCINETNPSGAIYIVKKLYP